MQLSQIRAHHDRRCFAPSAAPAEASGRVQLVPITVP